MKSILTILILSLSIHGFGQSNLDFKQETCDARADSTHELKERIITKRIVNDTLIVSVGIRDNCSRKYIANYTFTNDTLMLSLKDTCEEEVSCFCFHILNFRISNFNNDSIPILLNNKSYPHTEQRYMHYSSVIDTLESGNILTSKFQDELLIWEIEKTDSTTIFRQYYDGIFKTERTINNNSLSE